MYDESVPLRERERFLKLSSAEIDDCKPGEYGWLSSWETELNGVLFEMTTNVEETIRAIVEWGIEHEDEIGKFDVETDGKRFAFVQDGKPMNFDKAMGILNNFR